MKRILPVLALVIAALACNLPGDAPPPEQEPAPTPTAQLAAGETTEALDPTDALAATEDPPAPTDPPAATNTAVPTAEGAPAFPSVGFTANPDEPGLTTQFEEGVQEIFAVLEYINMQPGMEIRREWYRNGALWTLAEEIWDTDVHGINGLRTDISTFDFIDYLPPGSYVVQFYIDDVPQFGEDGARFFIASDGIAEPAYTDGGSRKATVENRVDLLVDGQTALTMPAQIDSMAWFPDGVHMAVAVLTNAQDNDGQGFFLAEHELYVVNVDEGVIVSQVGYADESFSTPNVSPDGRWIAAVGGSGFGDACAVDRNLAFIELDAGLIRLDAYLATALPLFATEGAFYFPTSDDDLLMPGAWVDDTTFRSAISVTCPAEGDAPAGIYEFDVPGQTGQRIGDIQEP